LSKDEIRIHYSGLIIFGAQIIGIVTGFIFTFLLTRNMPPTEYGIWSNIFDWMGYFTLLSGMFPFWVTRFIARGQEGVVRTALLANLSIGLVSVAFYFPLISVITRTLSLSGIYVLVYLVGSVQVINVYLIGLLESCLRAIRPQVIGYGFLLEEVSKVLLALLFIGVIHQIILGAMLSIIIAGLVQTLYYLRLLSWTLRQRIQWNYLKEWLKGSTAILYNAVGTQAAGFTIILLFIYGGQTARGDYQAAATFANVVGYSSFLAFALYPRLLARHNLEDVAMSLRMVLMFSIPIVSVVMSMARSLLTVEKVAYDVAAPVLILLTLDTFVVLLSQFYNSLVFGIEKLDEDAKIPLRKLVRSRIFRVFTLPYVQAAIAIPTVYYVLTRLVTGQSVQAAVWVIGINLVVHLGTFLGLYAMLRESVKMPIQWRSVARYLLASAAPAIVLYFAPHPTTLIPTFIMSVGGLAFYAVLLLAIDREARHLTALILQEMRKILSGSVPKTGTG
jgi:O-antigen/teichoic acid export membrane protein